MSTLLMDKNRLLKSGFCLFLMLLVSACGTFDGPQDGAPVGRIDPKILQDAIPRESLITRAGNKNPYTVLGKTYHLLPTGKGYKQRGTASWYGTKFHGRPTANGEPYSLYAMTAAHKTLPIPAYVKVTNLENQQTAIVRVNDRGPFHQGRIIDLSYAAAVKLGYAEKGTAPVEVEVIDPKRFHQSQQPPVAIPDERYFLQVAAFKRLDLANKLRAELMVETNKSVKVSADELGGFYRVQIGPLAKLSEVEQLSDRLLALNLGQPRLVKESLSDI